MRRMISLMLVMVMCMGLTAPAMAIYPETWDEAKKKFSMTTDMDIYDEVVKEDLTLYDMDLTWNEETRDYEETLIEDTSWVGYHVIGSDTKITIANTGTGSDYLLYFIHKIYVPDAQGRYVLYDECRLNGCSMRQGGYFMNRAADEYWGHEPENPKYERDKLLKLYAGESYTFAASKLPCWSDGLTSGALYKLIMYQYYPENEMAWYWSDLYLVDDQKAADIVAKGKSGDPGNPFVDVAKDAYYHDAVVWALKQGVTTGMTATTFGPDATCTRGQVATFLWRAKGCPEPKTTVNPFSDVKESDYFYKAVLWAYENGITTGATPTKFDPNGTCTSAHVVTFLWRANGKPAAEAAGTEYYAEAVAWANANKLLDGTAVPFAPNNLSPRADIVTYLYRDIAH